MKRLFVLTLLLLFFGSLAWGQTYTQTQPANCTLSDYVCNGIPVTGGSYGFGSGSGSLTVGSAFSFSVNGEAHYGTITKVIQQAPALRAGNTGPFSFAFTTGDGYSGTVSGQVLVKPVGRWAYAEIETSDLEVQ